MNAPVQSNIVTTQISQMADILGLGNVDPVELKNTLVATAFNTDKAISDEQMASLLIVAGQYKLNPWTKEIYAFPSNKGIIPVVGVDGWSRIINSSDNFDGMEFRYSENMLQMDGAKVPAPEWIECIIHRSDRKFPTVVREYLIECYQKPRGNSGYAGPWQSHPSRFLRHKATIQCARLAFGFVGIYDQDEAERIRENNTVKTVQGHDETAMPEGYQNFENEHLSVLKNEAQFGTDRLIQAHGNLPKNDWSKYLWTTHSIALKAVAELADQALARQGETYDHSPA